MICSSKYAGVRQSTRTICRKPELTTTTEGAGNGRIDRFELALVALQLQQPFAHAQDRGGSSGRPVEAPQELLSRRLGHRGQHGSGWRLKPQRRRPAPPRARHSVRVRIRRAAPRRSAPDRFGRARDKDREWPSPATPPAASPRSERSLRQPAMSRRTRMPSRANSAATRMNRFERAADLFEVAEVEAMVRV